ncbi:InlB B-repeat-containing protein [Streptomyces sp. NBC_00203]|uniref:InlB B-repeat-containing protein n=1 Tax=Streptomyces sp. NBC_00203 TaxID=2975680 RepID=UPI003252C6BF
MSIIASGTASGGIGYTPENPGPQWADWAYTVTAQSAISHYSFAHELGHNLGANHNWTTEPAQPDNGASGYFPKKGDWSSLMAYESGCRKATKGACGRINRFSNAQQTYRGEVLGVPTTKPGSADSSLVLNRTGTAVAAYRAAKTDNSLCGVTTSVSPTGGGSVTPEQQGPYTQGSKIYFTAKPSSGYVFDHWTLDGKKQTSTSTKIQLTLSADRTLKATFKKATTPASTVTTSTSGGGTVSTAKKSRDAGGDALYEAVPAPGWHFAEWRLDGSYAGDDDIALDPAPGTAQLTAVFERCRHTLDGRTEGGRGKVELSQPGPYADGDTVEATATPAKGYVFQDWLLDGQPYGGDEENAHGETAVTFQEQSHTLTAIFVRTRGMAGRP